MSNELSQTLLDIARSHASALKAEVKENELQRLRAEVTILEEKLRRARAEVIDLRSALRRLK